MKRLPFFFLALGLAAFFGAVVHLFHLRFASGDIYPAYSSLRSDPLGVKALFQSLGELVIARRNFSPLSKLGDGDSSTLFYLGLDPAQLTFNPHQVRQLESFVATGGRLIVSLRPRHEKPRPRSGGFFNQASATTNQPAPSRADRDLLRTNGEEAISLGKRWGFAADYAPVEKGETSSDRSVEVFLAPSAAVDLPTQVDWHSRVVLTNLDPAWRILYARPAGAGTLIERSLGDGTIVVATDSYLFSNEALLKNPQPSLLAWLVGSARQAIFDETHFGVAENPGVAALLRKYRLHGFIAALIFLAGLFVWKNALSLVPPVTSEDGLSHQPTVLGKEAAAGLVNLLRRNIPATALLPLCLGEWRKSCSHTVDSARLAQIDSLLVEQKPAKDRNAIETYRRISQILARKF